MFIIQNKVFDFPFLFFHSSLSFFNSSAVPLCGLIGDKGMNCYCCELMKHNSVSSQRPDKMLLVKFKDDLIYSSLQVEL